MDNNANSLIPPEVLKLMEQAAHFALTKEGDPAVLKKIREDAEKVREEVFQRHGLLDIGVPAIRELREE